METKFTKGKWKVSRPNNSNNEVKSEYGNICLVANNYGSEEMEANAKLISAAPEMFEALRVLMENYDSKGHLLNFDVNVARQALRKATD